MAIRVRHSSRYREIALALGRQGFGYLAEEIGLTKLFAVPLRWLHKPEPGSLTLGERIRLVLEELGPTFVKLGQLASTRSDLLPEAIIAELVKLQDQVPPFPGEEALGIMERELAMPVSEVLASFDEVPIAAASIGQVHKGRLVTGEAVAIKIQRPGVVPQVERDLDILKNLTAVMKKRFPWVTRYQLPQLVEEFARSILAELDYGIEARNMEKIRRQFADSGEIYIPSVHWLCSTPKVLTMDFVEGIHLNRTAELKRSGFGTGELAERLVNAMLEQIFTGGFFHADPHPGNLLATPDGKLAFIDFGMIGRLSPEMRDHLSSLVIALMRRSNEGMLRAVLRMGLLEDDADLDKLRADLERLHTRYYDIPFTEISIGEALRDLFATAQRHHIILPPDLLLLGKALLTLEGVALTLDPQLSILDLAEPFGKKLLREKFGTRNLGKHLVDGAIDLADAFTSLPRQVSRLATLVGKGKVRLEMSVPETEHILRKLDQIGNRLSFSLVLLAFSIIMVGLIIGSSLTSRPTLLWDVPAIEIGFIVAGLMVIWLLYSIFKSGRF
ncbi:AarF/ABC1/UbiB kinase family protein [Paenibacillus sp. M1]|uniref:AarF/ABC1/UbiB kinase family protein n=1 Tax=Paenibacillus haidiansis TaxID=1574488 RepID=A0ABU7VWU8_9BACL